MPKLYEIGWRQGTVFDAHLVASSYVYQDGEPTRIDEHFDRWVVVSQDCDLVALDSSDLVPAVEVMPVDSGEPPGIGWGIRSRSLRLSEDWYVRSEQPKLRLAPAALTVFTADMAPSLAANRIVGLKTWLGKRYDRPAVPELLVELGNGLAKAIKKRCPPGLDLFCDDVLFQALEERPAGYELIAVVTVEANKEAVRAWLAEAALDIDPAVGYLMNPPEALTKAELSLEIVENSYAANLSQITWSGQAPQA